MGDERLASEEKIRCLDESLLEARVNCRKRRLGIIRHLVKSDTPEYVNVLLYRTASAEKVVFAHRESESTCGQMKRVEMT